MTELSAQNVSSSESFAGGRLIYTFHIDFEGAVENDVTVTGLNLPSADPACVIIQPGTPGRARPGYPDKLVTFVGEVRTDRIQFRYRRVDSSADPAATFRFDFLVIF